MRHESETLDVEVSMRLDMVPVLRDRTCVTSLTGGITNRNFKVTTPDGTFVARVSSPESALLAIDRDAEHLNSTAAAASGAGARVVDYVPRAGILVVEYIDGRTFTDTDVRDAANLPRIADACHLLHSGPRFANDFDMFQVQQEYLRIVLERGFRLPRDYLTYEPRVRRMQQALSASPEPTVPCNNDLLPGNIIDTGDRLWLIDYEYSGNNDAYFELGNVWSEAALARPLLDELVTAYRGAPSDAHAARAWLWALMSKYGWTLWASIQDGSSSIDFDFWSWGMEKYERAVSDFASPYFDDALEEVAAAA